MAKSTNLDAFDIQILRELRRDGRISLQDLSERVGLSATPVARRLRQLEDSGIVTGYCALIDEVALGYEVSVFVSAPHSVADVSGVHRIRDCEDRLVFKSSRRRWHWSRNRSACGSTHWRWTWSRRRRRRQA